MAGPVEDRLMRLEESQGFAEHTVEQLNAELVEVNRRLAEAMSRVERLEQRIAQLLAPDESGGTDDSAGPDQRPHGFSD